MPHYVGISFRYGDPRKGLLDRTNYSYTLRSSRAIPASNASRTGTDCAQKGSGMIVLGRHRPLANDAWNELAVRAAIEEICLGVIGVFAVFVGLGSAVSSSGARLST